jgi:hypothetical protein
VGEAGPRVKALNTVGEAAGRTIGPSGHFDPQLARRVTEILGNAGLKELKGLNGRAGGREARRVRKIDF